MNASPPKATLQTADLTQVTAVIDAMLVLMGSTYTSCNASVSSGSSGSGGFPPSTGTSSSVTVADKYGNGFTVTQKSAGHVVAVTPLGVSLGPAETQSFAASVTDSGVEVVGAVVEWKITQGGHGFIDQNGLYTAPAEITANVSDTVVCTETASGSTCSFTVGLHP